jgi:hypothetical protein
MGPHAAGEQRTYCLLMTLFSHDCFFFSIWACIPLRMTGARFEGAGDIAARCGDCGGASGDGGRWGEDGGGDADGVARLTKHAPARIQPRPFRMRLSSPHQHNRM